jgi:integrase
LVGFHPDQQNADGDANFLRASLQQRLRNPARRVARVTWTRLRKKIGLTHVRLHDLRHFVVISTPSSLAVLSRAFSSLIQAPVVRYMWARLTSTSV